MSFTPFLLLLTVLSCSSDKVVLKKEKLEDSLEALGSLSQTSNQGPLLLDVSPTNKNTTYFQDVTEEYGLAGVSSVQNYAIDFDGDGHTDLVFLPEEYSVPEFYKFYPKENKYKKIESPFSEGVRGHFLIFLFEKQKKIPDVLFVTLARRTDIRQVSFRYFVGEKNKDSIQYKEKMDVFPESMSPVASVIPLDYNLDGKLDFFVAHWLETKAGKSKAVRDMLLTHTADGYKNTSQLLEGENEFNRDMEIYPNAYPSTGASLCDFSYNHYPDILVTTANGHPNKLWVNIEKNSHRAFEDRGKQSGLAHDDLGARDPKGGGFTLYSLCGDYNNDGIMDVLVGELFHSWESINKDRSSVLSGKSAAPEFFRTPYSIENAETSWSQSDRRGVWIDMNNDGLVDFIVENTGFPPHTRLVTFRQEANHAYSDMAKELGIDVLNPSGTITLDFNRDGKMDILVGSTNNRAPHLKTRVFLFKNVEDTGKNRAVRFYLRGDKANYHAIGATLKVKTNERLLSKFAQYSYGPAPSQNEEGTHFGIGTDKLQSVEVLWPIIINGKPLKRTYQLGKFAFKNFQEFTLCEDGKIKKGKTICN